MPKARGENGVERRLELDTFVPYRLSVVQQEVSRLIATAYVERYDLMRNDWRVMAALGNDQPLTANGICDRTNMDKVQVSRALSRLLHRGLVARSQDTQDRRRWILRLTESGETIYREIVPAARAREAELLAVLSDAERRQLDSLIDKLYGRAGQLLRGR